MAEKKIQENPLPDAMLPKDKPKSNAEVAVPVSVPEPAMTAIPSFTKTSPNDLYRKMLPAVLFLLTFVTVMTILLIYMDTVALGARQFRVNMSRDYELSRIAQDEPTLVAFVRQLHLPPAPAHHKQPIDTEEPPAMKYIDKEFGKDYVGTFVEVLWSGPLSPVTRWVERRGWSGVVSRAAPRDYFALRADSDRAQHNAVRRLHACLSHTDHPREITYGEAEGDEGGFRSRVLCLPLYTMLAAADLTAASLLLLGGPPALLPALTHLPYHRVSIRLISVQTQDLLLRNETTRFLATKNYTVLADLEDSVLYRLNH